MKVIYFIVLVLFTQSLFAQTSSLEMVTDRPDITESAITVPIHYLQIETGYQYNANDFDYTYHYGSTLLRYGLTSKVELRFAGEYQLLKIKPSVLSPLLSNVAANFNNSSTNQLNGFAGTMVGAKIRLIEEKNNGFNFAILTQLFLPWGKKGLVPKKIEPEIILSFDIKAAKRLSIGINSGLHRNSSSENFNLFYSVSSGITLSDVVSFYAEYSGVYENQTPESHLVHVIDSGFTLLFYRNIQLDFYSGTNVITNTLNWFWGTGISLRFPN